MPIVNTMAFLFTVLGEWFVEGKVISRGKHVPVQLMCHPQSKRPHVDTGIGMGLMLAGIALCVQSKA